MTCTHTRRVREDDGYHDWDGNWVEDWRWREVNTTVDVGVHNYKCTQCGQLFSYHGSLFTPATPENSRAK